MEVLVLMMGTIMVVSCISMLFIIYLSLARLVRVQEAHLRIFTAFVEVAVIRSHDNPEVSRILVDLVKALERKLQ